MIKAAPHSRPSTQVSDAQLSRSDPLPTPALVRSFGRSFGTPARCRPGGVRFASDLAEHLSLRDVDGFGGPHQLTTGRAENAVIWRAKAGEPPDHHRFLNAERRTIPVHTLRTKIYKTSWAEARGR